MILIQNSLHVLTDCPLHTCPLCGRRAVLSDLSPMLSSTTVAEAHAAHMRIRQQQRDQQHRELEEKNDGKEMGRALAPGAAAAVPLSLAQSCYADALVSIFRFLSLKEMVPVIQACRSWLRAALNEPSKGKDVIVTSARLGHLIISPLNYHITSISHDDSKFCFTLNELALLRYLPHLTALQCGLDGRSLAEAAAGGFPAQSALIHSRMMPPLLVDLKLTLLKKVGYVPSAVEQQHLVDIVAQIPALTALGLHFIDPHDKEPAAKLNFLPLRRLIHLSLLSLDDIELNDATIDQLKSLEGPISTLSLNNGTIPEGRLARRCRKPHNLSRLTDIDLDHTTFSVEHACCSRILLTEKDSSMQPCLSSET
jgi:hypothetical protein